MISNSIVEFCRFLRTNGFSIGIKETIDSFVVAEIVGLADRDAVHSAWRALFCSTREQCNWFDNLFENYWNRSGIMPVVSSDSQSVKLMAGPEGITKRVAVTSPVGLSDLEKATTGASAAERLKKTDFSQIPTADLPLLEQIALQLWKKMSVRMIRRWRTHGRHGPVDLRRTIRHSIGHGGDPVELMRKGRKRKKTNLVVLLDISGSMELYTAFLLRFVYALNQYFKRVDSFVFSTRLTPVSDAVRRRELAEVLSHLSEKVEDWSGGTRIGECIQEFNARYSRRLLTRHSVVMILSDGWDTGAPEMLSEQLATLRRRVRRFIWLNPLLGLAGYQPLTRGMSAAMPHADVFAPAHNLESLLQLEKHWRM